MTKPPVVVTTLFANLANAVSKGILYPKIKLGRFEFALASKSSKNAGSIYVTMSKEYMAKLSPAGILEVLPAYTSYTQELVDVLSDVTAAATAYGRKTGKCCICGRLLTAKESVAHSIGPICADKFGFSFGSLSDDLEIPDDF